MKELRQMRDAVISALRSGGLAAEAAFPGKWAAERKTALATVSVETAEGRDLGFGDTHHVGFLKRVKPEKRRSHLSGDNHHRGAVHQSVANAGNDIGRGRTRCDNHHSGATGDARISLRGVSGSLLMAHQYVTQAILVII